MKKDIRNRIMHLLDLLHKEYKMDNGISQEISEVRNIMLYEDRYRNIDDFICKNNICFERKPFSWEDEYSKSTTLRKEDIEYLKNKLATYDYECLLEDGNIHNTFNESTYNYEQYFLVTRGDNLYLVDTQGYSYIRYMVEIKSI
jgi:hypothetical protein